MILEDFIMLGKTVPEPSSDGRVFVCSAGWSDEFRKLIRIYPLAMRNTPPVWSISQVRLCRNPKDAREESWQLAGNRHGPAHKKINASFSVTRQLTSEEIQRTIERILDIEKRQADEDRRSLCVVQPDHPPILYYRENQDSDDHPQLKLFATSEDEKRALGAKRFPFQPRLRFSVNGHQHDLQYREWGAYEWMRKNQMDGRTDHPLRARLKQNPRLLFGNMNAKRNVWLVINALRPVDQLDLFSVAAE